MHIHHKPLHDAHNRQLLNHLLPSGLVWLNQVHSTLAIDAALVSCEPVANASFTNKKSVVCLVMTADCLPVLL